MMREYTAVAGGLPSLCPPPSSFVALIHFPLIIAAVLPPRTLLFFPKLEEMDWSVKRESPDDDGEYEFCLGRDGLSALGGGRGGVFDVLHLLLLVGVPGTLALFGLHVGRPQGEVVPQQLHD